MKNISTLNIYTLLLLILLPMTSVIAREHVARPLIMGSIQCPTELKHAPTIRVYCRGKKVKCDTDNKINRITFCAPKSFYQSKFTIIITPSIEFSSAQTPHSIDAKNTIDHLKVPVDATYKMYEVTINDPEESALETALIGKQKEETPVWHVVQKEFEDDRRIPDAAIIICFDPEYIDTLEQTTELELPTIMLKNDSATLAGSEEKLHERSQELVLQSIAYDTVHAQVDETVKTVHSRSLLVCPVTV